MQKLTNKEEEIMHILWKLKKAFVKEVMAEITEDQPHYNTLSTIVRNLEEKGFVIHNIIDYTSAEEDGFFLEGTGSLLLDRANAKAYCALSPRADEELFIEFCEDFDYAPVIFEAFQTVDGEPKLIYHTNVMMCL